MRVLNIAKGPAVRALRAQIDKITYPKEILKTLKDSQISQSSKGWLKI